MSKTKQETTGAIERAIDALCDTPTLLLLEGAWLGVKRFDEFQQKTGLMKAMVSSRLKKMVEIGVLYKSAYCEKPPRYEYLFTEMGLDLFPVAMMMLDWEQTWSDQEGRIQVSLSHSTCEAGNVKPVCSCAECNTEVRIQDVEHIIHAESGAAIGGYSKRRRQAGLDRKSTVLFDEISEIFGDRWLSLLIRAAFLGSKRYDTFLEMTGISSNILVSRLNLGIEKGLFVKRAYQSNPKRFEYLLTEKTYALYPILLFLVKWGDRWFGESAKNSVELVHKTCSEKLAPQISCSHCGKEMTVFNTSFKVAEPES
ncbi:winged helix-turn-helix transcriptional regulator [Kordiimonas laminariae]|uniref:winged helix-turn-helix transcriptional regulator n=1 Tax=Kordiimonas laminariae TaxID=2917717 RepID=UPI001FF1D48F|nr:helix-turn-helix domain-containing protein [Kordiimonas laminariae]MCK0069538.1 helix-turn-helix transcriptional regulator [Kordiimonas laminariae]